MEGSRSVGRCTRSSLRSARLQAGALCERIEPRLMLCAIPLDELPPAPEFDWSIERREAARLADLHSQRGGPENTSIVWTNRGQLSDRFDAVFGTSAAAARSVVDAALQSWQRVITSWNRADG